MIVIFVWSEKKLPFKYEMKALQLFLSFILSHTHIPIKGVPIGEDTLWRSVSIFVEVNGRKLKIKITIKLHGNTTQSFLFRAFIYSLFFLWFPKELLKDPTILKHTKDWQPYTTQRQKQKENVCTGDFKYKKIKNWVAHREKQSADKLVVWLLLKHKENFSFVGQF